MQCPTDGTTLVMSDRSGIEIDYCPTCRGVWLDRGELDKIIDRSLGQTAPPPAPAAQQQYPPQHQQQYQQQYQQPYQQGYYKKKRKESWLSELFD
ncbi:zf-TFIIB domain-containing protein [Nocardioides sp. YIM 152315]|uniref:TFIIB-type zinc ribbon-containing protein n=1 Tax=Nocardioides sp. YIM 152315 TaxID=3031760 RepID=UPI0023DA86E8|nr:zf-TFIIB domain-containing protein [Nocardioides sp. YIM 152315]MDF1605395.1 zf-TFIIB domain-containing protein [Nocardioides sp. YIM 152315]